MFTYRLNLYGGITIGDNLPSFYQYRVGGIFEQPIANYKQFAGYQFASLTDNNIFIASNDFQLRFSKNYFLLEISVLQICSALSNLKMLSNLITVQLVLPQVTNLLSGR
jgi:hypothetical protein